MRLVAPRRRSAQPDEPGERPQLSIQDEPLEFAADRREQLSRRSNRWLPERTCRIEADIQASVPGDVQLGDAIRLQSVFSNLLGNAVKFTPPGGIGALGTGAGAGEVCIVRAGYRPRHTERLSGRRIFEKFHRVHRQWHNSTAAGTGPWPAHRAGDRRTLSAGASNSKARRAAVLISGRSCLSAKRLKHP
jgi:hypothetical protein